MDAPKGNVKNPAIRRIHADIRELQKDPGDQYHAEPLEENLFEWHFTLRGPPGTDFEGGIYHGRILLPSEYPFKPPNIMLLTPNGRFEVGKKICLSISAHHPEHWQPAWGVRLILEALISFFPTDPKGAVGSLDWTPAERQRLARESQTWTCSRCGLAASLLPELKTEGGEGEGEANSGDAAQGGPGGTNGGGQKTSGAGRYAEEIKQLYVRGASGSVEDRATAGASDTGAAASSGEDSSPPAGGWSSENGTHVGPADQPVPPSTIANQSSSVSPHRNQSSAPPPPSTDPPLLHQRRGAPSGPTAPLPPQSPAATPVPQVSAATHQQQQVVENAGPPADDKLLYVAVALLVLIVALLARKVMRAYVMDF